MVIISHSPRHICVFVGMNSHLMDIRSALQGMVEVSRRTSYLGGREFVILILFKEVNNHLEPILHMYQENWLF
jgi:hypothetical protein